MFICSICQRLQQSCPVAAEEHKNYLELSFLGPDTSENVFTSISLLMTRKYFRFFWNEDLCILAVCSDNHKTLKSQIITFNISLKFSLDNLLFDIQNRIIIYIIILLLQMVSMVTNYYKWFSVCFY
jgi:hypothetical protein